MKIYTGTGDNGETGLFGGERVLKSSQRIKAYGTIDELNSFIGLALTEISNIEVKKLLKKIQNSLFTAGADLSAPDNEKTRKHNIPRISADMAVELEKEIDKYEAQLEELKNFILPGGTKSAALLHICRTICRRAEREVVELKSSVDIGTDIIVYLNRLSDLFFVLARFENKTSGHKDVEWQK